MASFGKSKRTVTAVKPGATNSAGGRAYTIDNPAERLVTMIGSSFFNEPKFYGPSLGRGGLAAFHAGTGKELATLGLDGVANDLIATAFAVATSNRPQDLLSIAHWARKECRIRTTPQVMLAIAAFCESAYNAANPGEGRHQVRAYCPKIIQRADEIREVFGSYLRFFGGPTNSKFTLPNCLKKGLADSFTRFDEYQLVKHNGEDWPRFKDVLMMVDRKSGWPLKHSLAHWLITDEIKDPAEIPVISKRKELAKLKEFNSRARILIEETGANWEVVVSQFGSKKEVWEAVIPQMGYMALLRNLRNFEQVSIGKAAQNIVTQKLVEQVASSKQLPFRFLSARNHVSAGWTMEAVDAALDASVANLPELPGSTAVFVDHSGSMNVRVSGGSEMTCWEAADVLAALIAKKAGARNCVVGIFGSSFLRVPFSGTSSTMDILEKIKKVGGLGGTYAGLPIQSLINEKVSVDRIVFFSDMQCYTNSQTPDFPQAIEQYRRSVNRNVRLHSVDLQGYGMSQDKNSNTFLLSGFSDKIINLFRQCEGLEGEEKVTPLEYIRQNF